MDFEDAFAVLQVMAESRQDVIELHPRIVMERMEEIYLESEREWLARK